MNCTPIVPIDRKYVRLSRTLLSALGSMALTLTAMAQTPAENTGQAGSTTTTTTTTVTPTQDQVSNEDTESNKNPIILNPLDVTATKDVGYGAATTASTSRVIQNYVDVPQTVNVVTAEFLQDYALQDVREALEYEPNMTFGLNNNSGSTRIRAAIVSNTYVDGVAIPYSYSAMPLDFFDRIEIVKGPSSAAFGLGEPGGLINYVTKTPQKVDATDFYVGGGEYGNFRTALDFQRVDPHNDKLSYRVVIFGEEGGYETPNIKHSGSGAQIAIRYDVDPTLRLDLISAYSTSNYPSEGIENSIWQQKTIYEAWQSTNLGSSIYAYLPGTQFSNGSIFGVSGTLPLPGTEVGILGTGHLAPIDSNLNPSDWASGGISYNEYRETFIVNKTFADGHISVRNALTLDYTTQNGDDETPDEIVAIPGTANTLPAAAAGNPSYGVPNGFTDTGVGAEAGYQGVPGQPFFGVGFSLTHSEGNATTRDDELDFLGDWKLFDDQVEFQALAGGDLYDSENNYLSWQWPDIYPGSGLPYEVNVYNSNNPPVPLQTNYSITGWGNSHTWGDGEYVQGDLKLLHGMLDLNAGWRIDFFNTENRNYQLGTYTSTGWVNTKGAPRYAITFKPKPWLSFYELYTVHKDPEQFTNKYFLASGTEWGPALQAQYPEGLLEGYEPGGVTIESGAKVSLFNGLLYASVAVFHDITQGQLNPIVAVNYINPDGTDTQIGVQQIQGTNVHGIEAEVFGQITRRTSFILNYGITRGYYPAFSNGTPDLVDPSATLSGHFKVDLGDLRGNGFYVNFGGEAFSPYYIWQGTYNSQDVSVYYNSWQYVIDGGVGFRWKMGKYRNSLYFNCDNITNQLVSIGTVTPWTVEPLRSWMLTYRVQF